MERRSNTRSRVLKSGVIEFGGGAIDCVVRNVSGRGAALDVASPVGIPEHVTLVIAGSRERHACRVIWRKERRIGVAFARG